MAMAIEAFLPELTFGVEMEFIFVFRMGDFRDWAGTEIEESTWYNMAKDFLASILNHQVFHPNLLQPSPINGVKVEKYRLLPFTNWILKGDSSIVASADEVSQILNTTRQVMHDQFGYFGIELVSPVFSFSSTDIIPHLLQIQRDLHIMGRPVNNKSTGLHVHFALAGAREFPQHVLQTLIIIWAICEPHIETMHPANRRHEVNTYAGSLLFYSRNDPWECFAARVYACASSYELAYLVGGKEVMKHTKVHISQAVPENGKPLTVEFREHRGTVDALETYWWTQFCGAMIQFSWTIAVANPRYFQEVSWDETLRKFGSLEDIFTMIGFDDAGREFYRMKVLEYQEPEPVDSSSSSNCYFNSEDRFYADRSVLAREGLMSTYAPPPE